MTTANLGFAIDSSPAKRAVVDLDALEAAAASTEAKVVSLGRRSKAAFAEVGAGATGFAAQLQSAAARAETLSDRLNRAMNIKKTFGGDERGRDIEEYGRRLDALRARYNPLYAQIQQYKSALAEIRQAHSFGAISVDEMTNAIQRERRAALDSIAALKNRKAALSSMEGGGQKFQTANIGAQLQDIGVTAFGGMSPLSIALQQGTQLSAILSTMDKPVLGLADAFRAVLNPLSLVTIGVVAAGAAAIQYFANTSSGTKTSEELLKRHEENIRRIGPAYEEALKAKNKYFLTNPDVAAADSADVEKRKLENLKKAALDAYSDITTSMVGNIFGSRGSADMFRFDAAKTALQEFKKSIDDGKPAVDAFTASIAELEKTGALSAKAATELRDKLSEARSQLETMADVKPFDATLFGFQQMQSAIDKVNPQDLAGRIGELESKLGDLRARMQAGKVSTEELDRTIRNLAAANPDLSAIIAEIGRVGKAALDTKANIDALNGVATTPKTGRVSTPDARDASLNFEMRWGEQKDDDSLVGKLKKQSEELERIAKKRDKVGQADRNAYRDLLKSAQDRIDQMKLEEQLVGKTGIAAEALRFELDLLQKSEDKGRSATAEQTKALKEKAAAYKEIAEKVAAARMGEELMFERQQMFRSPTEQRVYGELRNLGIDPASAAGEQLAQQIRLNEAIQQSIDLSRDFASTFVSDLMNGKSATEALGNAVSQLAQKLISMAMDQAINSLFGNLLGGMGGLFGGGGKSAFPSAPLPMYADGTNYAPGGMALIGERGPEVLKIPRGSQVIPNHKLRAANLNSGSALSGSQPMNFAPTYQIDARGADAAAVARIQAGLDKTNQNMKATIIDTVRQAQKGNVKLS